MSGETIQIPRPDLRDVEIVIHGVTPLLCNNGEQAVAELEAHHSRAKAEKAPRPQRNAALKEARLRASLYEVEPGVYGFPATGIAKAMRLAAARLGTRQGTVITAAIRIRDDLLRIEGSEPYCHTTNVRHGGRTPDLADRGCFTQWSIRIPITYNAEAISLETVVGLLELAGFAIGIGSWRPENNGTFGQFRVEGLPGL